MRRSPDFSSAVKGANEAHGPTLPWAGMGAGALALALVAMWLVDADLSRAQTALTAARAAAADAEQQARAGSSRGETLDALFAAQARLGTQAPPPRVLRDLQALQPPGVRLERIGLRYSATLDIDLEVYARQASDYDRFLAALEASPAFDSLTPGLENREGELRSSVSLRSTVRGTP
jgi:hypothetical protein